MAGEVPAYKIYEDELTYAFLTIEPVQPGHTLVISRVQVDHLEDLEPEDYQAVMDTTRKLMLHMRDELGCERVCLKIEGFEIPHAHVHLIPCNTAADLFEPTYEAGEDELRDMQQRLAY